MEINLNPLLNYRHRAVFQSTARELLVYGGAGAGKSYSIADKFLLAPIFQQRPLKILHVRRTLQSIKKTTLDIIQGEAAKFSLPFDFNRSDNIAHVGDTRWVFIGMNNKEDFLKVKSMTDVDLIWVNELNELREDDYRQLLLRLRGGQGKYHQIISDFNPLGTASWVFKRFFESRETALSVDLEKRRYTVLDNPWAEPEYVATLRALATDSLNHYKVYFLGEWGDIEGAVYTNWDAETPLPAKIDAIIYGLDFGFNNPTVLVRIYLCDGAFWIEELLYATHLTNADVIAKMLKMGIDRRDPIYCDTAEPNRIEEIKRAGFNAHPSDKDVDHGIDFVKAQRLHMLDGSENVIKEFRSYAYGKDKDGNWLDQPIKFADHSPDAVRYAIYTHCAHRIERRIRWI